MIIESRKCSQIKSNVMWNTDYPREAAADATNRLYVQ